MKSAIRFALSVLGLTGALAVHELAYALAELGGPLTSAFSSSPTVAHDHLGLLWGLTAPLGAAALLVIAVRQARALCSEPPAFGTVLVSILLPFLALEFAEYTASGVAPQRVLLVAPVAIGCVVAPVITWLIHRTLSVAEAVVDAVAAALRSDGRRAQKTRQHAGVIDSAPMLVPVRTDAFSFHRRGPPSRSI